MASPTRYDHCLLCEHRKMDFSRGTVCGLTDEKPDFNIHCPTFSFRNDIVQYNAQMNRTVDNPELNKINFTSKSMAQVIGGLVVLVLGIFATLMLWGMGWLWGLTLGVMGFGVTTFANGIRLFIRSAKDRKLALKKYEEYVTIIELYQRQGHAVKWLNSEPKIGQQRTINR